MAFTKSTSQSYISLSPGADSSKLGFSWYFEEAGKGVLQLLEKGDCPVQREFCTEGHPANDRGQYYFQITADMLKPDTEYEYRLINGETQSDRFGFRTGPASSFSFAAIGDPQLDSHAEKSNVPEWKKTLGIIGGHEFFKDVGFIVSTGDQIEEYNDEDDYAAYLEHDEMKRFPVATAIGNHDTDSPLYHRHFNVANFSSEYGKTAAGSNNYFVYNDALFLVLNTNIYVEAEHRDFLRETIAKHPDTRWRIVIFHNSVFTTGKHGPQRNLVAFREKLVPVLCEAGIDMVINGHDHIYCRSYVMDCLIPVTDPAKYDNPEMTKVTDPKGIVYITLNSASGIKCYDKTGDYDYDAMTNQEHIPNVSRVNVSNESLQIVTYRTTDMSVVDQFTIYKT